MIPSDCHPDRPRKTRAGECGNCYSRRRYREVPEVRERRKEASRIQWATQQRVLTDEQKAARRRRARDRYAADPRRVQSAVLKHKYGIDLDDYERMYEQQGGACPICKGRLTNGERRAAVDHDHDTGRVRGLLCKDCNTGLGHFGDDPARLRAAAVYVEHGGP